MKLEDNKFWFPAKKYGFGWGPPICWQGWVVVVAYVVLLVIGAWLFLPNHKAFLACVAGLTIVLCTICWLKGEKPRWRWGGK